MRITPEQIRTFLTVVRHGGVRRAAEHMYVSQPAITARIKQLEQALGADLFERTGSGMVLTKRGETMIRYAEQYLQLGELIQRDIADPAGVELRLRIGVSETIVQSWLPDFVRRLRQEFAKLEIEIQVDISVNLREALLNRTIDLALLMGPVSEYSIDNVDLPEFPLRWYGAVDDDLAGDPREIFLTRPIVTYARNTRPYRELKTTLFERYGSGATLFPSSSLSAGFRMVAAGLAVGALPECLALREVEAGSIRPFDPGWQPSALHFTASYIGDPRSLLAERAAAVAVAAATDFDKNI